MTRALVAMVLALLAGPLAAGAQPAARPARVGFLSANSAAADPMRPAFLAGLRELGYVEGQNLIVESRYVDGRFDRLAEPAAELVRLRCDVIVAAVTQSSLAARKATSTIPIVMIGVADPVGAGLVASLARPGGNVTGTSGAFTQVVGKQMELLKETLPDEPRIAVLWNPDNPVYQALQLREAQIAAKTLRVELQLVEARSLQDLERAFASLPPRRPLLIQGDPVFNSHRRRIAELARARRIPAVTGVSDYADAGVLLAYGPSLVELSRRSAVYVDKILKGTRPDELPVEEPTSFDLVINLKTARSIGVTVPRPVLLRAQRVID